MVFVELNSPDVQTAPRRRYSLVLDERVMVSITQPDFWISLVNGLAARSTPGLASGTTRGGGGYMYLMDGGRVRWPSIVDRAREIVDG